MQLLGYTGEASWSRASGAPKQAAAAEAASSRGEAVPSSRGDARAAGRARTGGAKSPGRKVSPDPLAVNAQEFASASRGKSLPGDWDLRELEQLSQPKAGAGLNKLATRTARGPSFKKF
jgi:hypothetical protein